jgi:hypothetical protein
MDGPTEEAVVGRWFYGAAGLPDRAGERDGLIAENLGAPRLDVGGRQAHKSVARAGAA